MSAIAPPAGAPGHTTASDAARLGRLRWGVRAVLTLGVAASIAANVLHARPSTISQIIAAWPPLALLLTVELISRVPTDRRALAAARLLATASIAGIAAWVSYWHMVGVAARYGETDAAAAYLLPISVDGLVIVASISLVEIAGRIRSAAPHLTTGPTPSRPTPADDQPAPAIDRPVVDRRRGRTRPGHTPGEEHHPATTAAADQAVIPSVRGLPPAPSRRPPPGLRPAATSVTERARPAPGRPERGGKQDAATAADSRLTRLGAGTEGELANAAGTDHSRSWAAPRRDDAANPEHPHTATITGVHDDGDEPAVPAGTAAAVAYWYHRDPSLHPAAIATRIGRSERTVRRHWPPTSQRTVIRLDNHPIERLPGP